VQKREDLMATSSQNHPGIRLEGMLAKNHLLEGAYQLLVNSLKTSKDLPSRDLRPGHTVQHCPQLESCTLCPPLKLLCGTLRATLAKLESAPTFATSHATVSPCVHHLQHCVQLRDAMLRTMMHRFSAPLGW